MQRLKKLVFICGVVLIAAFGPGLLENGFYFSSWQSDWVQAFSATVAVIVALLLPMYRDYKNDKKVESSKKDLETIAIFAIYHEAFKLRDFFKTVYGYLESSEYDKLKHYLSQENELTGNGYGRFDVSSALGCKYAAHYYMALTSKMQLRSDALEILDLIAHKNEFGVITYNPKRAVVEINEIERLAKKGVRISELLKNETEARSRSIEL
ncbi:hypothetical protein R3F64_13310 [Halomonas sp. 5021]|uniref:hypothetical protein n=1 Tax=Halomonas sp. 5021 TaxID=3082156 RepID=UPI002FC63FC6